MRKEQNYQWKELSLGTCYYPEHWDRNLWKEDLDRMLASYWRVCMEQSRTQRRGVYLCIF